MEILTFLFFAAVAVYGAFIALLAYGFKNIKSFETLGLEPKNKFSIIVPFRNEAENLPDLLHSFSQLDYSRNYFEVIFVDDASEDNSAEIIEKFPALSFPCSIASNERKSHSPKKDAILTAMCQACYEWIVTTDADCAVSPGWLKTLDAFIQTCQPEMVAGAVSIAASSGSFLEQFQQLDFISLQGASIGGFGISRPFMCNGANLAYTKKLFWDINGFEGNDAIASGDDVFLLHKALAACPEKVACLKSGEAIVLTKPSPGWKSLFYQRVRWASKASSYKNAFGKTLAIAVLAGNLAVVLALLLTLFSLFPFWNWYLLFAIKIMADFLVLYPAEKFLKPRAVKFFLLSCLLYPFFSSSAALFSLFGKYEWKGRKFRP
ncbi:MAG TPA: glycosyltransferase [Flavobacterium sp.]|nr:glycosyltransferase [Flavobacterium sp.]